MKIEEEKKELINREIAKFRDVYHKVAIVANIFLVIAIFPQVEEVLLNFYDTAYLFTVTVEPQI